MAVKKISARATVGQLRAAAEMVLGNTKKIADALELAAGASDDEALSEEALSALQVGDEGSAELDLTDEEIADAVDTDDSDDDGDVDADADGVDDDEDESVSETVTANEVSDMELRTVLHNALKQANPREYWIDIIAVYDDSVVYCTGGKTYQQSYTIDDEKTGAVTLGDDAAEVRSIQRFVPMTAAEIAAQQTTDQVANKTGLTNDVSVTHTSTNTNVEHRSTEQHDAKHEEKNSMKPSTQKATREQRIEKLVANQKTRLTKNDASWLTALPDAAFDRVEQVANEANVESVVEGASAGGVEGAETKPDETKPAAVATPAAKLTPIAAKPAVKPVAAADEEGDADGTDAPAKPKVASTTDGEDEPAERGEPQTAEEYIAKFEGPPEVKRMLQRSIALDREHKADLIATITANEANVFEKDELEAMDVDQLEPIAALAVKPAKNGQKPVTANETHAAKLDFVGRRVQTRAGAGKEEVIRMKPFGIRVGEALTSGGNGAGK